MIGCSAVSGTCDWPSRYERHWVSDLLRCWYCSSQLNSADVNNAALQACFQWPFLRGERWHHLRGERWHHLRGAAPGMNSCSTGRSAILSRSAIPTGAGPSSGSSRQPCAQPWSGEPWKETLAAIRAITKCVSVNNMAWLVSQADGYKFILVYGHTYWAWRLSHRGLYYVSAAKVALPCLMACLHNRRYCYAQSA